MFKYTEFTSSEVFWLHWWSILLFQSSQVFTEDKPPDARISNTEGNCLDLDGYLLVFFLGPLGLRWWLCLSRFYFAVNTVASPSVEISAPIFDNSTGKGDYPRVFNLPTGRVVCASSSPFLASFHIIIALWNALLTFFRVHSLKRVCLRRIRSSFPSTLHMFFVIYFAYVLIIHNPQLCIFNRSSSSLGLLLALLLDRFLFPWSQWKNLYPVLRSATAANTQHSRHS